MPETPRPLSGIVTIVALHLLADVRGFMAALLSLGLEPSATVIVDIPYSSKADTLADLWAMGFRRLHLSTTYPIDTAVRDAAEEAFALCRETNSRLLVIEDGGYVGPYIHRYHTEHLDLVAGIVEQTQNGIWQYEADDSAGAAAIVPVVPIVKVAESELKKELESPLIGNAIVRNIEELLARLGFSIAGITAAVLGFGATGRRVAEALRTRGVTVRTYDVSAECRSSAHSAGFEVADDVQSACSGANLIVGCTGKVPISADVLLGLQSDCYFANGSSKRREIDWSAMGALVRESELLSRSAGRRVTLYTERNITLLADGYPVNFFGESAPDEEIAFVYGLLLRSALLVLEAGLGPGFHEVPMELQTAVRDDHLRLLGRQAYPDLS